MNRFPSIRRYSKINQNGQNGAPGHSAWHSTSANLSEPSSIEFEALERKTSTQASSLATAGESKSVPHAKYAAIDVLSEDDHLRQLSGQHNGAGRLHTGYNPFFTRRWILLCFALLWLVVILSLQVLYSVSQSQHGIATTNDSLQYLWTYGPTAILVVITVLWRQVDYSAKYIQPWAELANGPLPATRTLLLDYITPLQIVAFWRALKLRHATVAITITVFVLIKVLTVISTGLLTLEAIDFHDVSQSMRATTVFDGSESIPIDSIDSRAAVGLYGAREYNMLLPNGTTERYAFQLFEPSSSVPNDTFAYNATVEVFTADSWECESGELTYKNGSDHNDVGDGTGLWENTPTMMYYNTTVKLPDCEIHNGHLDAPSSWYFTQNDTTPRYGYWGIFHNVNCSNLDDQDPLKQRYMISVAYSKGIGQDDNIMLNSSHTVCRPSYSIEKASVSLYSNGTVNGQISLTGAGRRLQGVSPDDVARAVYRSAQQASIPAPHVADDIQGDVFLNEMIRLTPDFKTENLMDNAWLTKKSKQAYEQYAAQVAGLYLLKSSSEPSDTFPGTIARHELRLVVKSLPTRLMQACAAVMFLSTIAMMFTVPQNVVPRSIESLAAVAVILAQSPELKHLLKHTGHLDMDALTQVLQRHQYKSVVASTSYGRTFQICTSNEEGAQSLVPAKEHSHIKWMQPVVTRRAALIATMVLAVCVFITLEVLFRYSEAHNGIADVDVGSLQKYAWQYTPVVVLVLLATTYNVLDFELEFADPYHQLSRGYTTAEKSLLWDPLRHVTPKTCLEAIRYSRFALVASSVSVLFAPMLTIAVSGLFSAKSVPSTANSSPTVQTWFNISSSSEYGADTSATFAIPALILQGNMSYPRDTFGEFALPSIDLGETSTGISNVTGGTFQIDTSAMRGAVNCSLIPDTRINNFTTSGGSYQCDNCINMNISTVTGCGNMGYGDSTAVWRVDYVDLPSSGSGFYGKIGNGAGDTYDYDLNETISCPSYYISYGNAENGRLKEWSLFECYTGFETVQVNATIDANQATVVGQPVVHAGSARKVGNTTWEPLISSTNDGGPYFPLINFTHADESFDSMFNVMVYGIDGVPKEQLLDRDTLVSQFSHTFKQWTAQWINSKMRNPVSELAKNATNTAGELPTNVAAIYTNPNRARLFLTEVSTRILQAVIAILLSCGIVIFILVDMSHVLPKSVGTIGAVASLLAGSRLVDEHSGLTPRGSEWLSNTEIKERRLWAGEQFRMGWWADEDGHDQSLFRSEVGAGAGDMYQLSPEKNISHFKIDARPRMES